MAVSLSLTTVVREIVNQLRDAGCEIQEDWKAGTVRALEDGVTVFWAVQKGKGGPWICRFVSAGRIVWKD